MPHFYLLRRITLLVGVVAALSAACAQAPDSRPSPERNAALATAGLHQIEAMIGLAPCRSDRNCHAIGVGARACGGPEGYRAWSALHTDEQALQSLVAADAAARRLAMQDKGMQSTCIFLPPPPVACIRQTASDAMGRCTLIKAGSAQR